MRILVALSLIAGTQACIGGGGGCCSSPAPACGNPCAGGFRGGPVGGGYAAAPIAPIGGPAYAVAPSVAVPPPPQPFAVPPPPPPPAPAPFAAPLAPIAPAPIGGGVQPIPLFGQSVGAQAPQGYAVPAAGFQSISQTSGIGAPIGGLTQSSGGFSDTQAVANFAPQQAPSPANGYAQPGGFAQQPTGGYAQPSASAQAIQAPISQPIAGAGGSYQEGPPTEVGGTSATFNQQPSGLGEQNHENLQSKEEPLHPTGNYQTKPQTFEPVVAPSIDTPSISVPAAPGPQISEASQPQPSPPLTEPAAPAPNTVNETEEGGEEDYGDEEAPTEESHPGPGPTPGAAQPVPAPPRPPIQPSIQISTATNPVQPFHPESPSTSSEPVVPAIKPIRIIMKPTKDGPKATLVQPSQPASHATTHEVSSSGSQENGDGISDAAGPVTSQESSASHENSVPAPQTSSGGLDFNKVHEDLNGSKSRSTIPGATRFTTVAPAPTTAAIDTIGGDEDYGDVEVSPENAGGQASTGSSSGQGSSTENAPAPALPNSSNIPSTLPKSSSSFNQPKAEVAPASTNTKGSGSSASSKSTGSSSVATSSGGGSTESLDGGSDYDSASSAHEEHPAPAPSFNGAGKSNPAPTQEIVEPQGFDYGAGSDYHEPEKNEPKIVNSENEAKATSGDGSYPDRVAGTRQLSATPIKTDTSLYPVEHSYMRRMRRA